MKRFGSKLIYSSISHRLSSRSREFKMKIIREMIIKINAKSILDIGVGLEWQGAQNTLHEAYSRGTVDIEQLVGCGIDDLSELHAKYNGSRFVYGNGLALPFESKRFDIAYSNAVIEHILPTEKRSQFIKEMLRVARGVFITTPNRWFPIEVHSRLPFVHWLPAGMNNMVLKTVGLSYLSRGSYFEPLSIRDLLLYFPESVRPNIRLGFLGMTIIAWYIPESKGG